MVDAPGGIAPPGAPTHFTILWTDVVRTFDEFQTSPPRIILCATGGGEGSAKQKVPVSIRDALNNPRDRNWIESQYPEYLEDLSQLSMNTGAFPAGREYRTELMARWFADDSSYPLIILKNEQPAGFALVSRPPRYKYNSGRDQIDFRMAEFFVALKSRRLGVGRDAAQLIFNRFAGSWEVTEFLYNKPAVSFWRAILMEYTGGKYREAITHGEVRQVFSSANRRPGR